MSETTPSTLQNQYPEFSKEFVFETNKPGAKITTENMSFKAVLENIRYNPYYKIRATKHYVDMLGFFYFWVQAPKGTLVDITKAFQVYYDPATGEYSWQVKDRYVKDLEEILHQTSTAEKNPTLWVTYEHLGKQ